jgi:antitoxin CptB
LRSKTGNPEKESLHCGGLVAPSPAQDASRLGAFDALLDQQDPVLWDWLMGHAEPPRADWQAIVIDIRTRAGLAR